MTRKSIERDHFYAVVMGFNRFEDTGSLPTLQFAEKDARDMYEVLVDERYGNYHRKNVILLTGKASQDEIETQLHQHIVKDREEEDTVLVYYSGHGFIAGDPEDAYLATPQITIHQILNNPKAGLQMKDLHDRIFAGSPARNVIFMLDCCYSGAFCPSIRAANSDAARGELIERGFFAGEGRMAFVSSPKGVSSRESVSYQNGVFTHYLLEGLKGGAADHESGEVTMSGLISYVEGLARTQPPLHYGLATKIVLTNPFGDEIKKRSAEGSSDEFAIIGRSSKSTLIRALPNPIDEHLTIIDELLACVGGVADDEFMGKKILNSIRCVLDADLVSVEELKEYSLLPRFESESKSGEHDFSHRRNRALTAVQSALIKPREQLGEGRFGFYVPYKGKQAEKNYLVIPLRLDAPREFLLITGVSPDKLRYGQILGRLLISLYDATEGLTSLSARRIVNTMFDDLKRWFGYVPDRIYSRRLDSFKNQLSEVSFGFEPIVALSKIEPRIDSWEALARDPQTNKAPFDLFKAAELWGRNFMRCLDLFCLKTATRDYSELWRTERAGQDRRDSLSVNVYPDTLYNDGYKAEVKRIVEDEEVLRPDELVLELSERRSTPKPIDSPNNLSALEVFLGELHEYTDRFNISFAIDDFGIGYSSVDRLAQLGLDHIKIDRDVLHHPNPEITIKYVLEMVKKMGPRQTKVVIEGYDGNHRILLAGLHKLGIKFVQGHLIRRGSLPANLAGLDQEAKTFIRNEMKKPPVIETDEMAGT